MIFTLYMSFGFTRLFFGGGGAVPVYSLLKSSGQGIGGFAILFYVFFKNLNDIHLK